MKHIKGVTTKLGRKDLINKFKQWDSEMNPPKLNFLQRVIKWIKLPTGVKETTW